MNQGPKGIEKLEPIESSETFFTLLRELLSTGSEAEVFEFQRRYLAVISSTNQAQKSVLSEPA